MSGRSFSRTTSEYTEQWGDMLKRRKGANRPSPDINLRRSTILAEESNESRSSSNVEGKQIDIGSGVRSVAFLDEGNLIVSGGDDGKIRCWRVEDWTEVETPIDVGDRVSSLAVSQDGEWIVAGTRRKVIVYLQSGKKVNEFEEDYSVEVLDISLDGTKIAIKIYLTSDTIFAESGDSDNLVFWSPSTGGRLPLKPLPPLELTGLGKFSRNSCLFATSTSSSRRSFGRCNVAKIRIHDSENSYVLRGADTPFVATALAWSGDGKQLFAYQESSDRLSQTSSGIHCFDISSKQTLFEWTIPGSSDLRAVPFSRMALMSVSSIDTFLSCCVNTSLSFWDTRSRQQIGSTIKLPYPAQSISISAKHDLLVFGGRGIIMYNLREILPSNVLEKNPRVPRRESTQALRIENDRSNDSLSRLSVSGGFARELYAGVKRTNNETIDSLGVDCRTDETTRDEIIAHHEKTTQQLRTRLADSERTAKEKEDSLEKTIKALREDIAVHSTTQRSSNEKIADLEKITEQLYTQLTNSKRSAREEGDALNEIIAALRADLAIQSTRSVRQDEKIRDLEATIEQLGTKLADSQQNAKGSLGKLRTELANSEQRAITLIEILHAQCEALYADSHVVHEAKMLLEITKFMSDNMRSNTMTMDWLPALTNKSIVELERIGDGASGTDKHDEALAAYAAALSLSPSTPNTLLTKWMGIMLLHGSTKDVTNSAKEFILPDIVIYQAVCDALERHGRITEAIECFQQFQTNLKSGRCERTEWDLDFLRRCAQRLKEVELSPQNCNEVNHLLSTILSLDSSDQVEILIKRSKARLMMESWKDALEDADEVIKLDSSSPLGYEQRRAALHGMKRYAEAVAAFYTVLKLRESSDERIRERCSQYTDARLMIREVIHKTTHDMPLELIDTETGDLLDRSKQKEAFEAEPIFNELVSSMATEIDAARIKLEVMKFYRYVMLSHRWQEPEPRYKDVKNTKVSELKPSFSKLKAFCELACSLKFRWAWCDTCCIDQGDSAVLHESLVSMFTWYRGSALTIVYLHDSPSKKLWESEWNRRAWTYQEYVASEVIQFYTKDWKRYVDSEGNHKKLTVIIDDMEKASQASAEQMAVLKPGRDSVREKLFLASRRESTRVEDTAYSLLGIFGIDIDIKYGERARAVGRFLENVLKGSYDSITILAWTGTPNPYNSCLPSSLTVYDSLEPPHIPNMEKTRLRKEMSKVTSDDVKQTVEVLDRLTFVSESVLAAGVLSLQCISCPISKLVLTSRSATKTNVQVYDATTTLFGKIKIETTSVLNKKSEYHVVHPWIHALRSPYSPTSAGPGKEKTARRLIVLMRQPFGALLLHRESWETYKRVAADRFIEARIPEEVPLSDLVDHINKFSVQ